MIKQRFLVQFGTKFVTHILGMVAGIVVARIAGPSVVGVLAYGTAYTSVLGFVTGLFGSAHIKLANEGLDHAECLAVFSMLRKVSAIIYLVLTVAMFLTQKYLLGYKFESSEIEIVIFISMIAHYVTLYEGYATTIYTAHLKQAKASIPSFLRNILWHLGRVIIVVLGYRAITLASYNLALAMFTALYSMYLLREFSVGEFKKDVFKRYMVYGYPAIIIVVVNTITGYADKLLLAHYTNTTQLGYYSAAFSIGGMFMLIAQPVGSIFFPLFAGLIRKGNWDAVNSNINKYQEFIILFVFPVMCLIALVGKAPLLLVLGKRYEPSVVPFVLLMFSTYIVLIGLPYGNVIAGMGKFYAYAVTNIIRLLAFFVSITVFISPRFLNLGATGLACNQVVLNLLSNAIYLYYVKKNGQVRIWGVNYLRQLVVVVFTIVAFFASISARRISLHWWVYFTPVYIILCYGLLAFTKLINKTHLTLLAEAFNLKKTFKYANSELRDE